MLNESLQEELIMLRQLVSQLQAELTTCRSHVNNYQQIFEAISDGVYIYDLEKGQMLDANSAMYSRLGYTREEFLALHPSACIHPESLPLFVDFLATVKAGKEFYGQGIDVHKNGTQFYFEVKGTLCQYNGQSNAMGIVRDISDRKKVELALQESQEFAQKIADNTPCTLYIYDIVEGRNIYSNREVTNTLGYSCEDIQAMGTEFFAKILHPEDFQKVADNQASVAKAKDGEILELEYRMQHKNGTWCWFLSSNAVFKRDRDGKVTQIIGSAQDITLRKATEAQLQEYGERQALINQLSSQIRNSLDVNTILETAIEELYKLLQVDWCAFSWFDPSVTPATWRVIYDVSWDGSNWIGSYPADTVGVSGQDLMHLELARIDDADLYEEPIHRAFLQQGGVKSRLTIPIKTQFNQLGIIICEHKQKLHTWEDNEIELLQAVAAQLAIAIDQAELYTQSQQKSEELKKTLGELKLTQAQMVQTEKMSSLGQMVAGIAHEINNPVGFIHSNLTFAENYVKDILHLLHLYQTNYPNPEPTIQAEIEDLELDFLIGDLSKLFSSMKTGTERIREIVLSLRTFSRLDEAELKTINIHESIDSTLVILEHRFKETNTRPAITVNKNYGDLPKVDCFAGYLNQVFMNIFNNAIDALEEAYNKNQRHLTIDITTKQINHNRIAIIIRDNGIGIPKSVKSLIFDPFFTTKPVGKGTGMGLASSYQIITEKHGGNLIFDSTFGESTEFVITIPVHQPGIDK
ncbi:MAG: PAS domain S-box protein [Scytonematopsis contorta HA4267-MV1]|jgi:PAS domain S-box-containing protein|nr:PAS domain S-box protein [Scytonematopsis contorta HA4267-MV1]